MSVGLGRWASVGAVVVVWVAAMTLQFASGNAALGLSDIVGTAAIALFFGVAVLLVVRVPENAVSWVMLTIVGVGGMWVLGDGLARLGTRLANAPLVQIGGFIGGIFLFALFPLVVSVLPLLFPTGAPPTPRWRWVWVSAAVGWLLIVIANLIVWANEGYEATENVSFDLSSPVRVAMFLGLALWLSSFAGGVVSLAVRWRRSEGVERAQLRWLVPSFTCLAIGVLAEFGGLQDSFLANAGIVLGLIFVPISIGLAITKYRLYDIGRIVSRTVTYAVLAALIAATYAVGAVWLPTRLGFDNPTFVAATTLGIAVAFNPVRRWLTSRLDRRFNRMRYDPQAVVDDLSVRLRDRTDAAAISTAWATAVNDALEPAAISVWTAE